MCAIIWKNLTAEALQGFSLYLDRKPDGCGRFSVPLSCEKSEPVRKVMIMKKISVCVTLILSVVYGWSQPKFFPHNSQLERWYVERPGVDMKEPAGKVMTSPSMEKLMKENGVKPDELVGGFHWIDFDRNGCPDLLFQGKIGDKDRTFLFRNLDDSAFVLAMEADGQIILANRPEDMSTLAVSLWNHSCCGDRVSVFSRWACVQMNGTAFMQRLDAGLVYDHTLLPDAGSQCLPKARFQTVNYASLLRMTPFIDDETPYDGTHGWKGNFLAKYLEGATGTVFHQLKDKSGTTWYFVRMDNSASLPIHSDRFKKSEEVEQPSQMFYYGWIHSGNVRILE